MKLFMVELFSEQCKYFDKIKCCEKFLSVGVVVWWLIDQDRVFYLEVNGG